MAEKEAIYDKKFGLQELLDLSRSLRNDPSLNPLINIPPNPQPRKVRGVRTDTKYVHHDYHQELTKHEAKKGTLKPQMTDEYIDWVHHQMHPGESMDQLQEHLIKSLSTSDIDEDSFRLLFQRSIRLSNNQEMEYDVLKRIITLIPERLRNYRDELRSLVKEASLEYTECNKNIAVEYILKKNDEQKKKGEDKGFANIETGVKDFHQIRHVLQKRLLSFDDTMTNILKQSQVHIKFKFMNKSLLAHLASEVAKSRTDLILTKPKTKQDSHLTSALKLATFSEIATTQMAKVREMILYEWHSEIFGQVYVKAISPFVKAKQKNLLAKIEPVSTNYYDCVSSLEFNLFREYQKDLVRDYVDIFMPNADTLSWINLGDPSANVMTSWTQLWSSYSQTIPISFSLDNSLKFLLVNNLPSFQVRLSLNTERHEITTEPSLQDFLIAFETTIDNLSKNTIANFPNIEAIFNGTYISNSHVEMGRFFDNASVDYKMLKDYRKLAKIEIFESEYLNDVKKDAKSQLRSLNVEFSLQIDCDVINTAKQRLSAAVKRSWQSVLDYTKLYQLFIDQIYTELDAGNLVQDVKRKQQIIADLSIKTPKNVVMPLFTVHCEDLNQQLILQSQKHIQKCINEMQSTLQRQQKKILQKYEHLKESEMGDFRTDILEIKDQFFAFSAVALLDEATTQGMTNVFVLYNKRKRK